MLLLSISLLASVPLSDLAHEGIHWISSISKEYKEPQYLCLNQTAISNNPDNIGILFVLNDLNYSKIEKSLPNIDILQYMSIDNIKTEEIIAMIITIIIMGISTFFFLINLLKK